MDKRRVTQVISTLLLHSSWGPQAKWLCSPVLNCHSCALAWFACPIGVFVHFADYRVFPYIAIGCIVVAGALVGRFLCGWVCPFGLLQDLLFKIKSPKIALPDWMNYGKYLVLALMVFLLPGLLGADTAWSFCRVCPAAAIQATLPAYFSGDIAEVGALMAIRLAILVFVLLLAVVASRSFCRVFCPIGALLAPFNFISFWTTKAPTEYCSGCKSCDKACLVDCQPSNQIVAQKPANRSLECIGCEECVDICKMKEE